MCIFRYDIGVIGFKHYCLTRLGRMDDTDEVILII